MTGLLPAHLVPSHFCKTFKLFTKQLPNSYQVNQVPSSLPKGLDCLYCTDNVLDYVKLLFQSKDS